MANQSLKKRRLEEKLGLNQAETIKSGFDQETMKIVWDIMNKKCDGLRDHPSVKKDEASWPNWVFFLVVHDIHAAIWAVEEQHMKCFEVVSQDYVTACDVGDCLKPSAVVRRFHVVVREDEHYYVQTDELQFHGKEPQFDICLYVGSLTLSLRGINAIMAMIADQNYLLLESDCLEYCKQFVSIYFELIEEEISEEQSDIMEKLTVTTNALSVASERSARRNRSSGFSLRSFLTSSFVQAYLATVLGGATLFLSHKLYTWLFEK